MPIISRFVKGIGSGIGLASEAVAHNKEKKAAQEAGTASPNNASRKRSPFPAADRKASTSSTEPDDSASEEFNGDDQDWALDEAATELEPPPPYADDNLGGTLGVSTSNRVNAFLQSHPWKSETGSSHPLPCPVVLPQRRPKDKSRGFVRAYSPVLGECAGIDQATFIAFIDDLDRASQTSKIFMAVNIAAMAVGNIPDPIAIAVSVSVRVAVGTATEIQGRYRANAYLDQMNEHFFKPRGLYCLTMTYKPDMPGQRTVGFDLTTGSSTTSSVSPGQEALSNSLSVPDDRVRATLKNLRLSSGTSKGELELPEVAALVYPALDTAAALALSTENPLPEKKQNALKSAGKFIADYVDRRSQAQFAGMHPGSKLAGPQQERQFASRFSDPNHPVNSGTLVGLLTGGHYDPTARQRGRRAQRRARRRGEQLSEADIKNAEMGRAPRRRQGVIRRILQKDVLYLMVVNMPSESEMREINQALEIEKTSNRDPSPYRRSPSSPGGGA